MRKFSRKFLLVDGKKYHLISVKEEWGGWGRPWDHIQQHFFRNKKSLCGDISFFDGDLSVDMSDGYCRRCARILQTGSKRE